MKRIAPIALVLAMVAVACGDDDATTTTAAATTTTAAATTTTAAGTTTTEDDGTAARVAAAQELEGDYEGEWHNTTFNSMGPVEASIAVDPAAASATLTLDLGGNVFGFPDPDPLTVVIDLSEEGPYEFTTDLFGDAELSVGEDGVFTFTAFSIDQLTGASLEVEGTVSAAGWDLVYTILNPAGSVFAEGTLEAAPAG